jgi:hypothetical protein
MTDAFFNMLPAAIGVAISPIPIASVFLMLMSVRAAKNGAAFAFGWLTALTAVTLGVLWLAGREDLAAGGEPSTATALIMLIIGLLFLAMALKNWQVRPRKGSEPQTPKWMAALDRFGPIKAFVLAFLLAGLNPKNLSLTVAGVLAIATAGINGSEQAILAIVFIAIGSVTVVLPVLFALMAKQRSARFLSVGKGWLIRNNAVIMAVILLLLGIKLTINGASGL